MFSAILSLLIAHSWACTSPAGVSGQIQYIAGDLKFCNGTVWKTLTISNLGQSCAVPGQISWASPDLRFCNGTNWIKINSATIEEVSSQPIGAFRYTSGKVQVSDGTNWYLAGPPASPLLTWSGSAKTEAECTGVGGVVTSTGVTGTVCRINAANCPAGWAQAANWSETVSNSTNCTNVAVPARSITCMGYTHSEAGYPGGTYSLSTGSHLWANQSVETQFYSYVTGISEELSNYYGGYCTDSFSSFSTGSGSASCGGLGSVKTQFQYQNTTGGFAIYYYATTSTGNIAATRTQIGCR